MITRKAGPALAAGCTMVLKPASQTPFSALALAELAIRAGVPAGVFNVVTGSAGAVGNELTSNPLVRKLSFTGSTEIGRQLMEQCAKEEGKRIYGDTIPGHQADKRLIVIKQPIGVTAAITPWNFPAAMITRKAGPALAAGCTMVLKPASQTPFSALALAELAIRAGIPAGVFNVVTGSAGAVGNELTSNPLVRKLSFTGSTEIGRQLMEQCAKDIKKVSLELGGNAPFIVFDDADLDKAVEGALSSKFRNAGQTCVCANRLYVQDGVYDRFAEKLQQAVSKLHIGDGLDKGARNSATPGKPASAPTVYTCRTACMTALPKNYSRR